MSAPQYPKMDTLYNRDDKFRVDTNDIRRPEFLIPRDYIVTEKIHGCNIRVSLEQDVRCGEHFTDRCESCWDDCEDPIWGVTLYGRKENSDIPARLVKHLQETFTLDKMMSLCLPKADGSIAPYQITLYGEGYGAGIQKGGGNYRRDDDVSFRLFDVNAGSDFRQSIGRRANNPGTWLALDAVIDIARKLDILTVPRLNPTEYGNNIAMITDSVRKGIPSVVAEQEGTDGHISEGVVAFTDPPLFNARGQRLAFKLKTADFA